MLTHIHPFYHCLIFWYLPINSSAGRHWWCLMLLDIHVRFSVWITCISPWHIPRVELKTGQLAFWYGCAIVHSPIRVWEWQSSTASSMLVRSTSDYKKPMGHLAVLWGSVSLMNNIRGLLYAGWTFMYFLFRNIQAALPYLIGLFAFL